MQQSLTAQQRMQQENNMRRENNILNTSMNSLTLGQDATNFNEQFMMNNNMNYAPLSKIHSIEDINAIDMASTPNQQMESQRQKLDEMEQMAMDALEEI